MRVRLFALAILCTFVVVLTISQSPNIHSQGKNDTSNTSLSKVEQDLLNEVNEARAHPDVYISYLEKLKPLFVGKVYKGTLETQEGWAAVEDAIAFLRTLKPQGPYSMSQGLRLAAAAHIKDQSSSGATGHKTTGSGSMIEDRVKPFGSWQGSIGENLSYGSDPARERLLTWLIDDGFATRGHRKRVMSADYRVAGVSCGKHLEYEMMCVFTMAGGFTDSLAAKPATGGGDKSGNMLKSQPTSATLSVTTPTPSNSNTNAGSNSNSAPANTNKSKPAPAKPRKL